jgi:hypothetical protein
VLGNLLVLALAAHAQADPIPLPAPMGRHAVGTVTARWSDSTRLDTVSRPIGPRQLSVQIWYPADHDGRLAPAAYAPFVDSTHGDYGHLMARVRPTASPEAPFSAALGRAPTIVFSTGRSMAAYDYTSLAEDLASHGYVVVAVNSPQLSRFFLPGGDQIQPFPPPPLSALQHFDSADVLFEPMVALVAADLRFVVQRLEGLDRSDPILNGHIDLERVGMSGHSNGALAGSRACAQEPRCRAFFGIEGTQAREIRKRGIRKPYGLLISDASLGFDAENVYRELGTRDSMPYTVVNVGGAGHNTCTDILLIRPELFHYQMAPTRGVAICRTAVRSFFDGTLRGADPGALLRTRLNQYPEVGVQSSFR